MTCKCGGVEAKTVGDVEICGQCEMVINEPNCCNHWWVYWSCIYPGDKVETWWSCTKCRIKKDFVRYEDTPESRKIALKSFSGHGD